MAGTTEGVEILKKLTSLKEIEIIATTTTKEGAELAKSAGAREVLSQALDMDGLSKLIKNRKIDILVDATHPFAVDATRNAIKASEMNKIKYIRLERPSIKIPENNLITPVRSFEEATLKIKDFNRKNDRILHLAGVMTLHYFTEILDAQNIVARVLPSVYSIKKCHELGLPPENIIAMQGIYTKNFNKALMDEFEISVMVTKESGETGGTISKIEAALELEIPVIMVMRPVILELENKIVFNNVNDVLRELK